VCIWTCVWWYYISNMRPYIVNMLIDKSFMGLEDRYCLIEKFLCTHAYECANIDIRNYPKLSKEVIAQERPCCSQRETPDFKSASYQYSLMFAMKWLSSFLLKWQLRNKTMWIGLGRLRTRNLPASIALCCYSSHIVHLHL